MVRIARALCLLLSLGAGSSVLGAPRALTLEAAIRLAEEGNPNLRMLIADVAAAKASLTGASLVLQSNPAVTASAGPRSSDAGRSRDSSLLIVQEFEIAGQRGLRIDAAQATLDAAEARLRAGRSEVTAGVRESFGRALAEAQRTQLASEALAVARQGVEAAEERFRAGVAALLEVNTARVELGRAARESAQAERRQAEALGELRLLVGFDPLEPITVEGDLSVVETSGELAALVQLALENRPELKASRRALDAGMAEARLAGRTWIPKPRIGGGFAREQESDASILQAVVGFDLPLFNRNQAARGVAAARVQQLEAALAATERQVRQEVVTGLARARAAEAATAGYAGDVVKAMKENMELVTDSYRAGKIDFLELVVIRRQALDARREYVDVLEELNAAQAQLDRAIGRTR